MDTTTPPAVPVDAYAALHQGLRWHVPARMNIAQLCCGRWAADRRHARRTESTGARYQSPRAPSYWPIAT